MAFLSGDGGKVMAIFIAACVGSVLFLFGCGLGLDILQAYREKRIRDLNRRMNK